MGDLLFELLVEAAFELAHFAAAQARHMDVITRSMTLVVVPVPAQMEQVKFVNQAVLLEKINRAVNSDEVYAGINFLRSFEDLVDVQVLLGLIHHLQNDAPLPRQPNAQPPNGLLQSTGGFRGVKPLTGGNPVRWRGSHASLSGCAESLPG
jgi:hypothetical protein